MSRILVPEMAPRLVGAAPAEPVELAELVEFLRDVPDQDQALVELLAIAAREHIEMFTRRKLMPAEFDLWFDRFPQPSGWFVLRPAPLLSVTEIEYVDPAGSLQTLASSEYDVDINREPGLVRLAFEKSWPDIRSHPDSVRIRFKAGAAGATAAAQRAVVPERAKLLIKTLTENYYDLGDAPDEIPDLFRRVAWGLRVAPQ